MGNNRSRYRIHLSTCVVLMFVGGFLLWMNLTPNYGSVRPSGRPEVQLQAETWGWPVAVYGRTMLISSNGISRPPAHWYGDPSFGFICIGNRNYDPILYDIVAAMLILGVVAWLCEYVIRRRNSHRE